MPFQALPFDPATRYTDIRMMGVEGFGAVYLIDDEAKAIVETGTSNDVRAILDAVGEFGTMAPIPPDRLRAVRDNETLDLGGRVLRFFDSPGHAPHQLTVLDEKNRCVYTGDAAGLYFPGDEILIPITPAPGFDLADNLATFRRLLALKPRALLFSHYGPHERPKEAIERQLIQYPAWDDLVRRFLADRGEDVTTEELFKLSCAGARRYPHDFLRRRIRNSVHGLAVYHERMERAARLPPRGPRPPGGREPLARVPGRDAAGPRGGQAPRGPQLPEAPPGPRDGPHAEPELERVRVRDARPPEGPPTVRLRPRVPAPPGGPHVREGPARRGGSRPRDRGRGRGRRRRGGDARPRRRGHRARGRERREQGGHVRPRRPVPRGGEAVLRGVRGVQDRHDPRPGRVAGPAGPKPPGGRRGRPRAEPVFRPDPRGPRDWPGHGPGRAHAAAGEAGPRPDRMNTPVHTPGEGI